MFLIIIIIVLTICVGLAVSRLNKENEPSEGTTPAKSHEELMADMQRSIALAEALYQSKIVGDKDTTDAILNNSYDGKLPIERLDGAWTSIYEDLRILKIAGIKYRGNLSEYVGSFKGLLAPEPNNKYDKFAIMVMAADGRHIGYIREDQTSLVRWMVGKEQPLGEETPTVLGPYGVDIIVREEQDCDDSTYLEGYVYIVKAK